MVEKLKIYFNNMKICLMYYLGSISIIYLLNINSEKSIIDKDIAFDKMKLLKNIVFKNSLCFFWILTGILFGQILIKSFLIVNGVVMGILLSKLINVYILYLILPHGVIEMGALLLVCCIVTEIVKQKVVSRYDKIYLGISYLFIIFAAFIETFITTSFIQYL